MAFLAPFLLGFAALAGVPLAVHLLRRRVSRRVDFPAVRYLTRMEQEHSRELKLRHRILLILRVLAVLALALAAARPVANLVGLGHAPLSLAIVIDNSMSSGAVRDGHAVLDDLRADALALVQSLTADDRAWIVTADGRVTGGPPSALGSVIGDLKPLGGRGDLSAATRRALALARSGTPRAPSIAIVGDGQENALALATSVSADSALAVGDVPVVALVRPRAALANHAVLSAEAVPARWTPSGAVQFAIASPDATPWRITLDGRTVARGSAPAGTLGSPARLAQKLASATNGWVRGSVELDADALRGDDARWFALRVAPPAAVATRNEAGPFLNTALATLVEEKRLGRGAEGGAGVVTVSGADAANLKGPVLLTAPSDPIRAGEANRTLARLGIPWRFGAISRALSAARGVDTRLPIGAGSAAGPAAGGTPGSAPGTSANVLDGAAVRTRYPLVFSPGAGGPPARTDTLATAGGVPWVVAGDEYVLVGSPIDPDATDLPLRAGFVPWLLESLSRRLGDDGQIVEAHPGQSLSGFGSITALERPDGSLIPLTGDRVTVPNNAGVYLLRRQTSRVGALVVNPEPEESDVGQGAGQGAQFLSHVSGRSVTVKATPDAWRSSIFQQAAGRSLLPPFVALALLALILEAWFSRGARTDGGADSERREPRATTSRAA
jgi:hypothetical protein